MELTNFVVNRTAENIAKAFGADIEKARHGIYADTPENRRLRRVGQEYGSKKAEEAPKGRPQAKQEEPKDERFSADGIVGKDGSFNKQGASYKRWAALREKVETGKATPEEKKEFAHIHNQYLNEKSRSEYERNKANDPNAKEPKYETVEERTARVKGDKEAKAERKKKLNELALKYIEESSGSDSEKEIAKYVLSGKSFEETEKMMIQRGYAKPHTTSFYYRPGAQLAWDAEKEARRIYKQNNSTAESNVEDNKPKELKSDNKPNKETNPLVEKLMSNKEFGSKISYINTRADYAIKYSYNLSSISERKGKDSIAYKRALVKDVLEDISVSDLETISRAVDKYGADAVKDAIISENKNNNSSEVSDVADAIILKTSKIEEMLNKHKRAIIADMFDDYGGGFNKGTDYFFNLYADEYAGDIIKEKGFNSFDEFETWFYEGDLNESQYNKATRIYKMIANAIPANLYIKTWPDGER